MASIRIQIVVDHARQMRPRVAGRAAPCAPCTSAAPAAKCSRPFRWTTFQFFGFPRKLNLDTAALEKEFYALSRRLHPDMFAQAESQERAWSLEQSSQLNDAYRTLKDPIKRTEYLLRLEGVELEEQSKQATEKARATGELKKQVVPPDLLEEVFELNMQLEELRMHRRRWARTIPALLEEIGKAKLSLEGKYDSLFARTEGRLDASGTQAVDGGDRKQTASKIRDHMVDVLNRRNYVRNLVRDVNESAGS